MSANQRSSQEEWRVRPARPDDAGAIASLLNTVFGDWGDRDYWEWKYQQPPAPFRLPSAVADLDGQVVGHYGIVPLLAVLDGEQVRGAQTVDAAVLPAYRRRGIHAALGRYVLDHAARAGVIWIYAFPGLFSLAVDQQRLRQRSVASVPEMVRVLRPWKALSLAMRLLPGDIYALWTARHETSWLPDTVRRLARLRRSLLLLASWASDPVVMQGRSRLGRSQGPQTLKVTAYDLAQGFDARFDALWAQVRDSTNLGVCKDAGYLTWRYRLNPRKCYRVFVTRHGSELVGLIVIRHAGRQSDITELLALPGRADVVSGLLATAINQAQRAGSIILTAWASAGHPHHASLRQAGFVSQRRLHWLSGRFPALSRWFYQVVDYAQHLSLEQQTRLAAHAKTWSLTMGDSDLV